MTAAPEISTTGTAFAGTSVMVSTALGLRDGNEADAIWLLLGSTILAAEMAGIQPETLARMLAAADTAQAREAFARILDACDEEGTA